MPETIAELPQTQPQAKTGFQGNHSRKSTINWDLAFVLRTRGLKTSEIAAELGCNVKTLSIGMSRKKFGDAAEKIRTDVRNELAADASRALRDKLSNLVLKQADALGSKKPSYRGIRNKKASQGDAAVLKTLAEAGKLIHNWGADGQGPAFGLTLLCAVPGQGQVQPIETEAQVTALPEAQVSPEHGQTTQPVVAQPVADSLVTEPSQ